MTVIASSEKVGVSVGVGDRVGVGVGTVGVGENVGVNVEVAVKVGVGVGVGSSNLRPYKRSVGILSPLGINKTSKLSTYTETSCSLDVFATWITGMRL
ncbi:MAG: hypothetical protein ACTSYX_08025, partial [Candidatus Thorarchaeota archaeon]